MSNLAPLLGLLFGGLLASFSLEVLETDPLVFLFALLVSINVGLVIERVGR